MAVRAADVVLEMSGSGKVAVLLAILVATEATIANFFCRSIFESKNFRFIAATIDVGLPWAVAGFASMPLGPFFRVQRRYKVRRIFIGLVETLGGHVFVTGLASFRADVK